MVLGTLHLIAFLSVACPSELSVGDYAELLSSEPSRKVGGVVQEMVNACCHLNFELHACE